MLLFALFVSFTHALSPFGCHFGAGTCGWRLEPPWNVVSMALMPTDDRARVAKVLSDGPFLVAQGKYGSNDVARATSQILSTSNRMRILAYRYQQHGAASLKIILVHGHNHTQETLLDTIKGGVADETMTWHRRSAIVPPVSTPAFLVFEAAHMHGADDLVAVDDVAVADTSTNNVMWAGQDSPFFDRDELKQRDIRRSQQKASTECSALKCSFRSSTCNWHASNIQKLPTKIVNEALGESSLVSPPVLLPAHAAHLSALIFDSATSNTWISLRRVGGDEKEVWRKGDGEPNQSGEWRRISVPLDGVDMPVRIVIRSMNRGENDFVAFSSLDLVDEKGESLSCEPAASPIQPQTVEHHQSRQIRLTALQNLKISPLESLLYQPPLSTTGLPPPTIGFNLDEPRVAVLPIAPAQVSARGVPILPSAPLVFPIPALLPETQTPKSPFHR